MSPVPVHLICLLAWIGTAFAETSDRVYRVSVLAEGRAVELTRRIVIPELAKLGFEQGRNLNVETHAGPAEKMRDLAQEVVALMPDAIIAIGNVSLVAAKQATATIPLVALGPDLVELGYAENLARPGGNLTGVVILSVELNAKRLELLHEAIPTARRIAILMHPLNALNDASRRATSAVATRVGIEALYFEAARREDYASVVAEMRAAGAEGLAINADAQFAREGADLAALAQKHGLPTICQWREMAEQGCFLSYGPNLADLYRRLAALTGRILRGRAPRELPIEQPSQFEFVVNGKTAKAIGQPLPPALLVRADDVIE